MIDCIYLHLQNIPQNLTSEKKYKLDIVFWTKTFFKSNKFIHLISYEKFDGCFGISGNHWIFHLIVLDENYPKRLMCDMVFFDKGTFLWKALMK